MSGASSEGSLQHLLPVRILQPRIVVGHGDAVMGHGAWGRRSATGGKREDFSVIGSGS